MNKLYCDRCKIEIIKDACEVQLENKYDLCIDCYNFLIDSIIKYSPIETNENIKISSRTRNALLRNDIKSIEQARSLGKNRLLELDGIGNVCIREIFN